MNRRTSRIEIKKHVEILGEGVSHSLPTPLPDLSNRKSKGNKICIYNKKYPKNEYLFSSIKNT
jgi:hypothetical protein